MAARRPAVAGQFYEGSKQGCVDEVKTCLSEIGVLAELPDRIVCGIVPHAGWLYSGDVAGKVFSAIKQVGPIDTFVIFGAVHRYMGSAAAVYDKGSWLTPLGEIQIDEGLAERIVGGTSAVANLEVHKHEHSIEVQVPFVQYLFPEAKIVPIMAPAVVGAVEFGNEVGEVIKGVTDKNVVCIASTDLTHYGPRYGFCPAGEGSDGLQWATEVNDTAFIDLALKIDTEGLFAGAVEKGNACGPGAAAAVVAVAKKMGKNKGVLLGHTNSNEVMEKKFNQTGQESVGYAGIVF